jgi:RNase H-fold protein (predicted Holliday junction resolvase)
MSEDLPDYRDAVQKFRAERRAEARRERIHELMRDYMTEDSVICGLVVDLEEAADKYRSALEQVAERLEGEVPNGNSRVLSGLARIARKALGEVS